MRTAAALGHIGLLFGLLGVILMLAQLEMRISGTVGAGFLFATVVWVVGVLFAVAEWFELKRPD